MRVAFALQKLLAFLCCKKFQHICLSLDVNFNESLTNDVVSFEQLGPEYSLYQHVELHASTTFILNIGTHQLLTIPILKFEQAHFITC